MASLFGRQADYEILSGGGSLIDGTLSREDEKVLLDWVTRVAGEAMPRG